MPLFGTAHCLWLVFGGIFLFLAVYWYRRGNRKARRKYRMAAAAALLMDEFIKYAVVLFADEAHAEYLPLHLCSLGIFAVLGYARRPSAQTGEFLFAAILPGAAAALLFPGWSILPAASLLSLHSFSFHFLLLAAVLAPLGAGEICPDIRRLPGCAAFLLCMTLPISVINRRFGTNFFFLSVPGEGNPLSFFEIIWGNPGYLAALPLLCIGVWAVLYGAVYAAAFRKNVPHRRRGTVQEPSLLYPAEKRGAVFDKR